MELRRTLGVELPIIQAPMAGAPPLCGAAEARGSGDFSPLWCGQNASGCKAIPAAEVTRALAEV